MLRLTNKEPMPLPDPAKGEDNAEGSPLATIPVGQQHEVLAALYIARQDATVGVKQAAHFVWKIALTLTLTVTPIPNPNPNP